MPLLLLGARSLDDLADHVGDGGGAGGRRARIGEFLDREREGDGARLRAAVVGGDVQCHEAGVGKKLQVLQELRPALSPVETLGERRKPLCPDPPRGIADHLLFGIEAELHGRGAIRGPTRWR